MSKFTQNCYSHMHTHAGKIFKVARIGNRTQFELYPNHQQKNLN